MAKLIDFPLGIRDGLYTRSQPAETQCRYPVCMPEDYQQRLGDEIKGDFFTGEPATEELRRLREDIGSCRRVMFRLEQEKQEAREWVGLTDEEIHSITGYQETREIYRFTRAIEAKLKEKNSG